MKISLKKIGMFSVVALLLLTIVYSAVPTYTRISDDYSWFKGDVGIGTTSPSRLLHLKQESGSQIRLEITDGAASGGMLWRVNDTLIASLNYQGQGVATTARQNDLEIDARNGGDITFQTQGTGNVGIGTATPTTTLDVSGTIHSNNITVGINPEQGYGKRLGKYWQQANSDTVFLNMTNLISNQDGMQGSILIYDFTSNEINRFDFACKFRNTEVRGSSSETGSSTQYNIQLLTGTDYCAVYFDETGDAQATVTMDWLNMICFSEDCPLTNTYMVQ